MAEVIWKFCPLLEPYTIEVDDKFKLLFRNMWDNKQMSLINSEKVTTELVATHYAILKSSVGVGMFVGTAVLENFLRNKWPDGERESIDDIL
jgi:hypothetical protein